MRHLPATSTASFLSGLWFVFQDSGRRRIGVWCGALSGNQKVVVDGEVVSTQRHVLRGATHTFTRQNDEYQVTLSSESLTNGIFDCILTKNGLPVGHQRALFTPPKSSGYRLVTSVLVTAAILLGWWFGVTSWQLATFVPGALLLFIVVTVRDSGFSFADLAPQ
ncbi:MAG: hypothetical protein VX663_11520 [Pseudomonadota bacterium]|nr:hypothetical protein [Pseudomonadota bacterium]